MSQRSFRVRHHECDPYGHLNNVAYLRYVEELEIDLGHAAPAGALLPGRVDIAYLAPARFGDTVDVLRAHRGEAVGYELTTSSGVVARVEIDWRAPESLPIGDLDAITGFPEQPFRLQRPIDWRDLDETGRASVPTLAALAEDAGVAVCAMHGWPLDRCGDEGFAIVLRRHEIVVGSLPGFGDVVDVETWFSDRTRVSVIRHYVMSVAGAPIARFRTHYVWVDALTMRPIRIPDSFIGDFAVNEVV
jgi:acyl-CoA thioesterase FadM